MEVGGNFDKVTFSSEIPSYPVKTYISSYFQA